MSQVNIQNLLQMPAIEPTQVQRTPVEFREASFSGGAFRPGEMSALPTKTSEQYMYEALSQIATGTQQGLNTFAEISSRIDNQRIAETETEWERIDAQDIDPREKVKQFNNYIGQVSTPMSSDLWKKKMANRMSKSWGQEAFEKFVADEYTEQAKQWEEYDGKMGPVLTNKFLAQFEKNNPSLTGSNFVKSLRIQTAKQLDNLQDKLMSNVLVASVANDFTLAPQVVEGLAQGTIDAEELRSMHPNSVKLIELAQSSQDLDEFRDHLAVEFYGPIQDQISGYNPETQFDVKLQLDGIFASVSQQIWNQATQVQHAQNERTNAALALSAQTPYEAAPNEQNLNDFAIKSSLVLSNMPEFQQLAYLQNAFVKVYKGLATGKFPNYSNFTDLPPNKQLQIAEELFVKAFNLEELSTHVIKHKKLIQTQNANSIMSFVRDSFRVSEQGQALQSGVLTSVDELTEEIINSIQLNPSLPQDIAIGRWTEELAKRTGLSITDVNNFFFTQAKDEEGNVIKDENDKPVMVFDTRTVDQKFTENSELVNKFVKAGFTPPALRKLSGFLAKLTTDWNQITSAGAKTGAPREREFVTIADASKKLLTDHKFVDLVQKVVKDPSQLESLPPERIEDLLLAQEALQQANIEVQTVATQVALTELNLSSSDIELLSTDEPLDEIDQNRRLQLQEMLNSKVTELYGVNLENIQAFDPLKPVNFESFFEQEWVEKNGKLSANGRLLALRSMFYSREMAQNIDAPGQDTFVKNLREKLRLINENNQPISELNRNELYPILYMVRGLSLADQSKITAFGGASRLDNQLGTQFIRFLATTQIPDNLSKLDNSTKVFLNAVDIASRALRGGETAGKILDPISQRGLISVNQIAENLIGIGDGSLKLFYPEEGEDYEASKHTDQALNAFCQTLGFSEVSSDPAERLNLAYTFLMSFLSPGNNGKQIPVLDPSYTGDMYVTSPVTGKPVLFRDMPADDKLAFYIGRAATNNLAGLQTALIFGAIGNQILQETKTTTPKLQASAISALSMSGVLWNNQQELAGNPISVPSLIWDNRELGLLGLGWSPQLLDYNVRSIAPSLDYSAMRDSWRYDKMTIEQMQQADPSFLLQALPQAIGGTPFFPTFEEISNVADSASDADFRGLVRGEFESKFSTGTPANERKGIRKGLNPASQLVVGLGSLPVTEDNINTLVTMFTDGLRTSEDLDQNKLKQLLLDPQSKSLSLFEVISQIDPTIGTQIRTTLRDMQLGVGARNSLSLTANLNGTAAVFSFQNANGEYQTLAVPIVPEQLPVASENNPTLYQNYKRYVKTLLYIDRLQKNEVEIPRPKPPLSGLTPEQLYKRYIK